MSGDWTALLEQARAGDRAAIEALFHSAYSDLQQLARARLRAGPRATLLDTTALVHECYLRMTGAGQLRVEDRAHFFRYAGRAMRSVIVDFARARGAERRGGQVDHITWTTGVGDRMSGEAEIVRVHEALERLAVNDARLVQVVEMRYFGGLSEAEVGEALGLSERQVRRDWEKARLLLAEDLGG